MRKSPLVVLASALSLAGCGRETKGVEAPREAAQAPAAPAPRPFGLGDLAAARALDARLARLAWLAADFQLSLAEDPPAAFVARARALGPRIQAASSAVADALRQVSQPADRAAADRAAAAATRLASAVSGAAAAPASGDAASALARARADLGKEASEYRRSRGAWPPVSSAPEGAARELDDVRRELERIEAEAGEVHSVAPRDEGHKMDWGSRRLSAEQAALAGRDAAAKVDPALRDSASRWVAAQDRAVQTLLQLGAAPQARRRALSLAYAQARADALDALAEYTSLRAQAAR